MAFFHVFNSRPHFVLGNGSLVASMTSKLPILVITTLEESPILKYFSILTLFVTFIATPAFSNQQLTQYFLTIAEPTIAKSSANLTGLCEDFAKLNNLKLLGLRDVNFEIDNGNFISVTCVLEMNKIPLVK